MVMFLVEIWEMMQVGIIRDEVNLEKYHFLS